MKRLVLFISAALAWPGPALAEDLPVGFAGIEFDQDFMVIGASRSFGYDQSDGDRTTYLLTDPVDYAGRSFELYFDIKKDRVTYLKLQNKMAVVSRDACLSETDSLSADLAKRYGVFDGQAQDSDSGLPPTPQRQITKTSADGSRKLTVRTLFFGKDNCFVWVELWRP